MAEIGIDELFSQIGYFHEAKPYPARRLSFRNDVIRRIDLSDALMLDAFPGRPFLIPFATV